MSVISSNKLVDLSLLGVFKTEIDKVIAAGDKAITDELGTLPSKVDDTNITTWLGYIDAKVAQANSSTSEVSGKVDTLIGDDASKSARTIAAEEVAKVVASAPEAFDTLKEIADWIGSGDDIKATTAASMLSDLTKLKGSKTVEGSVLHSIDQAIIALDLANTYDAKGSAATAESNAKSYADGLAVNYDAAGSASTAESNAKSYADGLATNYDAAGSAATAKSEAIAACDAKGSAAAVQGSTTETVKSVNDKVEALTMATEAEVKALFSAE